MSLMEQPILPFHAGPNLGRGSSSFQASRNGTTVLDPGKDGPRFPHMLDTSGGPETLALNLGMAQVSHRCWIYLGGRKHGPSIWGGRPNPTGTDITQIGHGRGSLPPVDHPGRFRIFCFGSAAKNGVGGTLLSEQELWVGSEG